MTKACQHKNPVQRDGTSQLQRFSNALDPTFVRVDERDYDDLIRFAMKYGRYLKWYNFKNQEDGDWFPFFRRDISSIISTLAGLELKPHFQFLDYLLNQLNTQTDAEALKKNLKYLFDYAFGLCAFIDQEQHYLAKDLLLGEFIRNNIQNNLQVHLARLLTYHRYCINESIFEASDRSIPEDTPIEWLFSQDVLSKGLSHLWINGCTDWKTFVGSIEADEKIFGGKTDTTEMMQHAATYNLFTSSLESIVKSLARINEVAGRFLIQTLTDWPSHAPNHTLYLVFLKLFRFAQDHINQFTKRHLDFYYRDVLRFGERRSTPAKVHLLLGLARHLSQYRLEKDTMFRAGKDGLGRNAYFGLERELVVNQAQVTDLKSIFFDPEEKTRFYAAPVIHSADGLGEMITESPPRWKAFRNHHIPEGKIGFALSSHYLYLREGTRNISIDVSLTEKVENLNLSEAFEAYLTTEKAWLHKKDISATQTLGGKGIQFNIGLTPKDPAILAWNSAAHKDPFQQNLPAIKILLRNNTNQFKAIYAALRKTKIIEIILKVDVSGIRDLAISNDQGPQDPSRPFLPFGQLPKKGNAMVIGNKEVFQKKLTDLRINLRWKGFPENFEHFTFPALIIDAYYPPVSGTGSGIWITKPPLPTVSIACLQKENNNNNVWKEIRDNENVFAMEHKSFSINVDDIPESDIDFSENNFFDLNKKDGFLKLTLNKGLGHKEREEDYILKLMELANNNVLVKVDDDKFQIVRIQNGNDLPHEPYTPELNSITLGYEAKTNVALSNRVGFEDRELRFYHLSPFGLAERHVGLPASDEQQKKGIPLLPKFGNGNEENQGELYIGISNLDPPENLSLLFQLVEGSANPLKEKPKKPEKHIRWSYLHHNYWYPFDEDDIQDSTKELLQSGIIQFAIPKEADDQNTLLPSGKHWLRLEVPEETDMVCDFIGIHAQAGLASFRNRNNDPVFGTPPLASGAISKLESGSASIKKIMQPYSSFGERAPETDMQFYTRISERLRHKKRSSNIWDYERMVLEHFPEIYKVKCVNHTMFSKEGYNEMAPGHVLIVPIANIKNRETANPFLPYTNQGLLEEIECFLRKHTSPFVKIHVKNPLFESVKLDFKVHFHADLDPTFYKRKLKKDISHLLSPWAFEEGRDIAFGGVWYQSVLIDFIEELPYVDYLTDFKLKQFCGETDTVGTEVEEAVANTARSILTSHHTHAVEEI